MDKATYLGAKQKEKEAALEKAQVAESSLEELKDKFRELRRQEGPSPSPNPSPNPNRNPSLRRQEEAMLREVETAEAEGRDAVDLRPNPHPNLNAKVNPNPSPNPNPNQVDLLVREREALQARKLESSEVVLLVRDDRVLSP